MTSADRVWLCFAVLKGFAFLWFGLVDAKPTKYGWWLGTVGVLVIVLAAYYIVNGPPFFLL